MAPSRPRRLFLALLALALLLLLLLLLPLTSRRSISGLFSTDVHASALPDEIFGLLHFVTSPDEADRALTALDDPLPRDTAGDGGVVPEQPIEMAWYAFGATTKAGERGAGKSARGGWDERLRVLRDDHPLIVFSKTYCPYSNRAKRLLETYDISPPPKIIEVDLRADASHIKTLLTRLTHRSTFPNVILHGRSLGGSDDLMRLHEEHQLKAVLEAAGMQVRWTGQVGEGILP